MIITRQEALELVAKLREQVKTQGRHSERVCSENRRADPYDNDHYDAARLMERAAAFIEAHSTPTEKETWSDHEGNLVEGAGVSITPTLAARLSQVTAERDGLREAVKYAADIISQFDLSPGVFLAQAKNELDRALSRLTEQDAEKGGDKVTITRQEAVELVTRALYERNPRFYSTIVPTRVTPLLTKIPYDQMASTGLLRYGADAQAAITALESAGLLHWPEQEK